jgi:hypothetical protein
MGRQLAVIVLLAMLGGPVYAERVALPADLWDRPRSGDIILALPGLKHAVDLLLEYPEARLLIHHGKGEESMLQAEELRAWLVALAVDGARLELIPDGKLSEGLNLELTGIIVEEKTEEAVVSKGNP